MSGKIYTARDAAHQRFVEMIAKNEQSWNSNYSNGTSRTRDYSLEEIKQIINSSSLASQQKLSRNYFDKNGFYKRKIGRASCRERV